MISNVVATVFFPLRGIVEGGRRLLSLLLLCVCVEVLGQTCVPTATFYYTVVEDDVKKEQEEEAESYSGSAPVRGVFRANPEDADGYEARYEWKIYVPGQEATPIVHRFEETMEYTFMSSGTFIVELAATFVRGDDTVVYPEEGEEGTRFSVTVLESKLTMPNAFSPGNGDEMNNVYKVKEHESIISFKATVFNRWGKKLYSWDDVDGCWDGKVGGKYVKDGVYFVNVVAKGADGHVYHIRKDINVLTGRLNEESGTTTEEP